MNPVLVEVYRGPIVESAHRGAVAVVDAAGGCVLALQIRLQGGVGHSVWV